MQLSLRKLFVSGFGAWLLVGATMLYFLYPPAKKLSFGIDLVGGTYVTLSADTDTAVSKELKDQVAYVVAALKEKNISFSQESFEQDAILHFKDAETVKKAKSTIEDLKTKLSFNIDGLNIKLFFADSTVNDLKTMALETNLEVLRNRLNSIGVEEVSVGLEGDSSIVVELPNIQDPQQAKAMIGTPAVLEFKMVDSIATSRADLLDKFDGEVPFNMTVVTGEGYKHKDKIYYLLDDSTKITGTGLKHASPGRDPQTLNVVVQFEFDKDAGKQFSALTRKNIGKSLAIVLDNKVISAPRINSEIGSQGVIQGNFTEKEASELSKMLNSGSFAAPLNFEEERTIEPSLGKESIRSGIISCLVGLGLLFFFSLFYYGLCGLFAFLALVFNLILILFGLSWVGAALTLPGIAGMVLTVGMAIDASILIFERMRELSNSGMPAFEVVKQGFSSAFTVILDANITTLIVGIVLFKFGTGPVKGFAVTMMLGIISTLITGLSFLRSLFTAYVDSGRIRKLSI